MKSEQYPKLSINKSNKWAHRFFFFFSFWETSEHIGSLSIRGVQKTEELKKPLQTNQTNAKISVWFWFSFYKNLVSVSVSVSHTNTPTRPKPNQNILNINLYKKIKKDPSILVARTRVFTFLTQVRPIVNAILFILSLF